MPDLHFTDARATDTEIAAIDAVLGPDETAVVFVGERLARGGEHRRRELRHLLLPGLHALQRESGWISPGGLNYLCERLGVPPAEGFGVASFYDLFEVDAAPDHDDAITHVCVDPACAIGGADAVMAELTERGHHVHPSPCLGQCDRAPGVFIQGRRTSDSVPSDMEPFHLAQGDDPGLVVLARVGAVDPTSLDSYRQHGGYAALDAAIEMGPDAVIAAITDAGLSGRGGAAFPTGIKWRAVRDADGTDKHVVANCDESEPGTFKDRILLEHDPFSLIEAMTIAGLATGAQRGWVYVRGEYPRPTERLVAAIDQARDSGLLGADVAGSGHRFDIEIRRGAGAYICGEETALFNSIEGYRGEPRNKPPFPTTNGLFDQPTAINNPETLANVLPIVVHGSDHYRSRGTEQSPGTRLFCLSGQVRRPGVYEHPFGTTLRQVIDTAGGIAGTGVLQAVLLGGAAGTFATPDQLDTPLSYEATRAAGLSLGSGVVMVFDTSVDLGLVCERIAQFFRNESCGQCVPCRVGAVRQHEMMVAFTGSRRLDDDTRQCHEDMYRAMADASICGLGHTAGSAIRSALAHGLIGASP